MLIGRTSHRRVRATAARHACAAPSPVGRVRALVETDLVVRAEEDDEAEEMAQKAAEQAARLAAEAEAESREAEAAAAQA